MQPAPSASVLVIDDEPVVLDLFQRVLAEKGLSTRLARNAEEALALLEREEFGCVLADKNLPGLNGIEVLRRVRQTQPYCACIIMTAYASTQSAVEALRIGAIDYIEKPFDDLDAIADRIDEAVKQMKVQYERRAPVTPLRLIDGEGPANELPEEAQQPEASGGGDQGPAATPIEILQARVRHATTDLRHRSLHLLSRLVASKAAGREVLLSGEALLDELRRLRETGGPGAPELRRIEQKLEEHLALARHAQSR
jgi:two-component system, cell cycle sensor histidine kinase and response regulator CckA